MPNVVITTEEEEVKLQFACKFATLLKLAASEGMTDMAKKFEGYERVMKSSELMGPDRVKMIVIETFVFPDMRSAESMVKAEKFNWKHESDHRLVAAAGKPTTALGVYARPPGDPN